MAFLKVAVVVVLAMLCINQASCRHQHKHHGIGAQSQEDAKPEPKPFIGGLIKGVGNVIEGAANTVGNVVGGAVNGAGSIVGGAVNGAGQIIGGALKGIANLATGIVNGAAVVLGGVACGVGKVGAAIVGQNFNCGPKMTCTWREGTIGNGVTFSVRLEKNTGDACAKKCYELSQQDGYANINGANVLWSSINGASVAHADRTCYCAYGVTALNPYQAATSCMFQKDKKKDAKVAKEKDISDTTEEFDWRAEASRAEKEAKKKDQSRSKFHHLGPWYDWRDEASRAEKKRKRDFDYVPMKKL